MALVKVVLAGSSVTNYASSASMRVRYYVDLQGHGTLSPDAMTDAIRQVPQIGTVRSVGIPGAPGATAVTGSFAGTRRVHQMRVAGHTTGSQGTGSGQKHYIDVLYESRPQPTIEYGSSASQTRTSTYLAADYTRKQMTLDWLEKKDLRGAGIPPEDIPWIKNPVSGTRMEFGASVRIASTWYAEELSQDKISYLSGKYNTAVNQFPLFFYRGVGNNLNDSRLWICTSVSGVSADGGYTTRLAGEFVYSPIGWDTIAVYTAAHSNQLAILTDAVVAALYAPLQLNAGVPPPYNPKQTGAGKFPQQVTRDVNGLIGFLSQGILWPQPNLNTL